MSKETKTFAVGKSEWETHTKTWWRKEKGEWKKVTEVYYKRRKK